MAELKLNISVGNLADVAKQLSSLTIGKISGGNGGIGFGGATKIGLMTAGITELVKKTQAIQTILDVIAGFLNALITPFVPILIGLMKPFFILFQLVGQMLLKWLLKAGVSGESKTGATTGAVVGAVGGFTIGGGVGAVIGAALTTFAGALLEMLLKWVIDFGANLLTNSILWVDKFLGTNFKKAFSDIGSGLSKMILGLWNIIKGIFTFNFTMIGKGILDYWIGLGQFLWGLLQIIGNLIAAPFIRLTQFLWEILKKTWDSIKNVFNSFIGWLWNGLKSFINLFISGLNKLIALLNKIPGINIDSVRSMGIGPAPTINVNIAGDVSSQSTFENLMKVMRDAQNRRGTF